MPDWKTFKGQGPWSLNLQPDKWGYLNNPGWNGEDQLANYSNDPLNEPVVWDLIPVEKTVYNEGTHYTSANDPVWYLDARFGTVPVSQKHDYCGYWWKFNLVAM